MDSLRFQRLVTVFEHARGVPPDERSAVLDASCADDAGLRREVEELLRHHDAAESSPSEVLLDAGSHLREELNCGREPPLSDLTLPAQVGRYRIRGEIARGGFGVVLRGEDATIGRDVAVKVLPPGRVVPPAVAERLRVEGRICGRLQHPGIVPVYELGDAGDGSPFLAMKVVEGRTLATLLRSRAGLADDRARGIAIFEQVCQAVAYAHAQGVLHRDLKPQNLMVGAFGEVQVMDWGLAEAFAAQDDSAAARRSVAAVGTPAYMAPEQARGEPGALDPRCDVFGLGAILCEILTGEPPFRGEGTATVVEQARAGDLRDALDRLAACGAEAELVELTGRCLAPDPADRPADAREVARDVRAFLDSLEARARDAELAAASAHARAKADRRARRLTAALGAFAVLVTLVGAGVWLLVEHAARERAALADRRLQTALLDAERLAADASALPTETSVRWEAAAQAARNARQLATGTVDPELAVRADALLRTVTGRLRDVRFVEELETLSLEERFLDAFDRRPEIASYGAALERYLERDLDHLSVRDAATALADFAFRDRLVRWFDNWATIEGQVDRQSPRMKWIRGVANELDTDEWRIGVRRAAASGDVEQLIALAESDAATAASAGALLPLALELLLADRREESLRVLEHAQWQDPDDFEVNLNLAIVHEERGELDAGLRFATAAAALRPESAMPLVMIGGMFGRQKVFDEAVRYARRGAEIAGGAFGPTSLAAQTLFQAGLFDEAAGLAAPLAETVAENHAAYSQLMVLLGDIRLAQGRLDEAVEWFRRCVLAPRCTLREPAWTVSNPALVSVLRDALRARSSGSAGFDAASTYLLARLEERAGRWQESLLILERLEERQPGFCWTPAHIRRLRSMLGRGLLTHATVDDAILRLEPDLPLDAARAELLGGREEDTEDPHGLRAYAEGRLLVRAGRPAEAIPLLERAVAADREALAPWRALHAAHRAHAGDEAAGHAIRALLAIGGAPPRRVLDVPPAPPELVVAEVEADGSGSVTLAVAGWRVADPRQMHVGTVWQVRALDGDFVRHPRVDLLGKADTELVIPTGVLEAGRTYAWRAAFVAEGPVGSLWSEEGLIRVPVEAPRAIPVDLVGSCTADVVAEPGDTGGEPFDPPNRFRLVVDGFDGERAGDPTVQGLPGDGCVGRHRLAPFDGKNCVQVDARSRPIRIPLPRGRHDAVLLLGASGNGNSGIPAGILYDDGTVERFTVAIPDWFTAGRTDDFLSHHGGTQLCRRMDRMGPTGVEQRDEAKLFELLVPCDRGRVAIALLLEPAGGIYDSPTTSANLLAVTVMTRDPDVRGNGR